MADLGEGSEASPLVFGKTRGPKGRGPEKISAGQGISFRLSVVNRQIIMTIILASNVSPLFYISPYVL